MNKPSAIFLSAIASFAMVTSATARTGKRASENSEQRFQAIDFDRNATIDEAELLLALQSRQDKQAQLLARLELSGSPKADQLVERMQAESQDALLGTPESASPFIIANFDEDGDWELNQVEMSQAFSSLRKWRAETR